MADVDEFLASGLAPLTAADTASHDGDAGPRIALWSRDDPVTLFGALQIKTGWPEIALVFCIGTPIPYRTMTRRARSSAV